MNKHIPDDCQVVLDMSDVFKHSIEIRDKDGFLIEKIEAYPDKSMDIFFTTKKYIDKILEKRRTNGIV